MTTFYLVRHGQTSGGPGDPGLSERGREQAYETGQYLKAMGIAQVYASPLRRALETATAIADILDLTLQIEPRLRERMNWGDVPDQSYAEFIAHWERANRDRTYRIPGGSSPQEAGDRMAGWLREMAACYPEENIVAVSHSGILSDFLTGYSQPDMLAQLDLDWVAKGSRVIEHCSVTKVACHENSFQVLELALTHYD